MSILKIWAIYPSFDSNGELWTSAHPLSSVHKPLTLIPFNPDWIRTIFPQWMMITPQLYK